MYDPDVEIPVKVLLVDDEENILRSLKRLLMDEGHEILFSTSGEQALQILKQEPDIGLIISDQRMPGLTGTDFLEQAKNIRPLAVRILLTGYSDINAAIDAINRGGATRYLAKPWKDDEIRLAVREACQRYVLIQKNKQLANIVLKQNDELKRWSQELEFHVQEQTIELSRQNDALKKLTERLRGDLRKTIVALSSLIELRDKQVKSHSRNVAEIASKTAAAMGRPFDEIENITIASLLHDIGKIGMPDVLLTKDIADFNQEEAKEYQLHSIRGQSAVDTIEDLRPAGILIRHHHESFDGTGFPDRLKGEEIPLGARIIAMADHIDRSIGRTTGSSDVKKTIRSLEDELGKRFDPKLLGSMLAPLEDLYSRNINEVITTERELDPKNLTEGMVVSRDIKSGTGLILCSQGIRLNAANIQSIRRYYSIDPPSQGVFVQLSIP
jgi:response regulator RpfG family c-di-GMP phosphodiesterase